MANCNPGRFCVTVRAVSQTLWAPVAQLDRALASGARGREFESRRARHFGTKLGTPKRAVFALEAATARSFAKLRSDKNTDQAPRQQVLRRFAAQSTCRIFGDRTCIRVAKSAEPRCGSGGCGVCSLQIGCRRTTRMVHLVLPATGSGYPESNLNRREPRWASRRFLAVRRSSPLRLRSVEVGVRSADLARRNPTRRPGRTAWQSRVG